MKDLINIIKRHGVKYQSKLYIAFVGVLVVKLLSVLPSILTGRIIDNLQNTKIVIPFFISLVIVAILKTMLSPIQTKQLTNVIQNIVKDASKDWSQIILNKDYSFFQGLKIGSLLRSSERGIQSYEKFLIFAFVVFIPSIVEIILIGGYLTYLTGIGISTILVLCAILFISLIYKTISWRRPYILNVNDAEDDLADSFAETVGNARTIKLYDANLNASKQLFDAYDTYANSATKLSFASELVKSVRGAFVLLVSIGILALGVLLQNGSVKMSVGDFVIIFTMATMFMTNVSTLVEAYQALDEFKTDKLQFDKILNLPNFRENLIESANCVSSNDSSITIKPFKYSVEGKEILANSQDIKISHGEKIAIIGETGSGKTTLANILTGVYTTKESVFIGKSDINQLSSKAISNYFGTSLQDPQFMSGSLKRSVFLDHFDVDTKFLSEHGRKLGLEKILPMQSQDSFSVKGVSGGEAKRLSLLRTLAASCPITMLDEPTSALDDQKASEVWDHLFDCFQDKTMICITHDTKNLHRFDRIIRVENGILNLN